MVSSRYKIGNKGFALHRMTQAGLPVPACFYVPVERLNTIEIADIESALAGLGTNSVAVRSSAVEEDRTRASFAGIYVTRLNLRGAQEVKKALEEVRDSTLSPGAVAYRQTHGITGSPQIAAVVQQFINADVSGIAFTADPLAASDNLIVEACWGLGEALAGGTVTPDRWVLSKDGVIVSSTINDKDTAIVQDEAGGTKQVDVAAPRRRCSCLDSDLLHRLFKLAIKCERLFGSPQDIEWAIASNELWLLQSRPIDRISPTARFR